MRVCRLGIEKTFKPNTFYNWAYTNVMPQQLIEQKQENEQAITDMLTDFKTSEGHEIDINEAVLMGICFETQGELQEKARCLLRHKFYEKHSIT
jgi:hypothetical protein